MSAQLSKTVITAIIILQQMLHSMGIRCGFSFLVGTKQFASEPGTKGCIAKLHSTLY
jgi:hypothetical protein